MTDIADRTTTANAISPRNHMATLLLPFRSLSDEQFIGRGSAGQVFAINRDIVFKFPTRFSNPAPPQEEEMANSLVNMRREMRIHELLQQHRHPSIIHSVLCIPEGVFMQRLDHTLDRRLAGPSDDATQARWIQQIASGAAWLEKLGLVHGDLRPANVLVDARDNLRLTDFDATVTIGAELLVASEPFCKLNADLEPPPAGPESEQFSLGSCFYNIRFGHIPFCHLDPPTRVRMLSNGTFPSTSGDVIYGDVTFACWQGSFPSIAALVAALGKLHALPAPDSSPSEETDQEMLLHQCMTFLAGAMSAFDSPSIANKVHT